MVHINKIKSSDQLEKNVKTDFWILSPEDVGAAPILKKGSKTEGKIDPE